jgi:UPF0176 protein
MYFIRPVNVLKFKTMPQLHNRVSQKELKEKLYAEDFKRIPVSFYKYFTLSDSQSFRDELYMALKELDVFGRIYIAQEGINAQISIPEHNFDAFKTYIHSIPYFKQLRLNVAIEQAKAFWVLKIKVREKIVADGINDPDFSLENRGDYVDATTMNLLLNNPETLVVDMRNHYEYEVGHFENAIEIPSDTFREQLPMAVEMLKEQKDKTIIMYCTGGIRCEKASAYMKHNGFEKVHHLEGGIINYANQIKELGLPSKFIGKNFVFDDRLGERITNDVIAKCHQCGTPADTHTNCKNEACHLLFIQCEACTTNYNGCCCQACADELALPEDIRKERRKGIDKGQMIFNKAKARLRPRISNT